MINFLLDFVFLRPSVLLPAANEVAGNFQLCLSVILFTGESPM